MFFFQLELLDLASCRTCSCHSKGCIASGVHPFFHKISHGDTCWISLRCWHPSARGSLLIHGQESLDATLQDLFVDSKKHRSVSCGFGSCSNFTKSILREFPGSVLKWWRMDNSRKVDLSSNLFNVTEVFQHVCLKEHPKTSLVLQHMNTEYCYHQTTIPPSHHKLGMNKEWKVEEPLKECQFIQIVVCYTSFLLLWVYSIIFSHIWPSS